MEAATSEDAESRFRLPKAFYSALFCFLVVTLGFAISTWAEGGNSFWYWLPFGVLGVIALVTHAVDTWLSRKDIGEGFDHLAAEQREKIGT